MNIDEAKRTLSQFSHDQRKFIGELVSGAMTIERQEFICANADRLKVHVEPKTKHKICKQQIQMHRLCRELRGER